MNDITMQTASNLFRVFRQDNEAVLIDQVTVDFLRRKTSDE